MKSATGCCCGVIVGCVLAVILLGLAAMGLYFYFNPEARQQGVSAAESAWGQVKTGVDSGIEKVKQEERQVMPEPVVFVER